VCVSVAHRTHDGVDGVVAGASELFYGDLGSSTADYRAVGRAIGPLNPVSISAVWSRTTPLLGGAGPWD